MSHSSPLLYISRLQQNSPWCVELAITFGCDRQNYCLPKGHRLDSGWRENCGMSFCPCHVVVPFSSQLKKFGCAILGCDVFCLSHINHSFYVGILGVLLREQKLEPGP